MGNGSEAKRGRQRLGRKRDHSYDEAFKGLSRPTMERFFELVITDYELLFGSKRVDLMLARPKCEIEGSLNIFSYLKDYNLIEFKSERDRFRGNKELGILYCYYGGALIGESGATIENTSFTLVCSIKPKKFLNYYETTTTQVKKGVYLVKGIFVIPLYVLVPDEIEGEFDREMAFIKEFSRGKERESCLREILRRVSAGEEGYNSYLAYACSLYRDEIYKLAQEEGLNMTLMEKNMLAWMDDFNLKERFILEGEKKGKMEDARKMLEKGFEVEVISEITGLSCGDIIALKDSDVN